jgi:hypothetical protein
MTDTEIIKLNQNNHTSGLLIITGILQNILTRQHTEALAYRDPKATYIETDLTIIQQLNNQLIQMKIRNQ